MYVCSVGTGVSVFSLHPGVVQSDLWRHQHRCIQVAVKLFGWFTKTPVEGAQTTLFCALEPGLESQSGGYFRYTNTHTHTRMRTHTHTHTQTCTHAHVCVCVPHASSMEKLEWDRSNL